MRRIALVVAAALLAGGCGDGGGGSGFTRDGGEAGDRPPATTTRVEVVESIGTEGGFDPQRIYARDAPGVVTITAVFESGGAATGRGQGSGFVVDDRGEIVTNAHVVTIGEDEDIERASELYVEFSDGNQVEAEIVGTDPNADIALLRIDPAGLTLRPLELGSSADVSVGEPVAAIGSPFGERQSLSVGVVSAVDRAIDSLTGFSISGAVQTDAAINPGNSGGPLVDAAGRVIGVNQSIRSRSGGGEGVGFAVPIDTVKRSVEALRDDGEVEYAYLGVSSATLYPQLVERFELPVQDGAWVQSVIDGGPADRAGIRGGGSAVRFQAQGYNPGGDIVTRIGDTPVADADDLSEAILDHRPGDRVAVRVYRDGRSRTITVTLGERPLDADAG